MKTIHKLLLTSLLASTLSATIYENAVIFNDPRTLGMGGTGVASGGNTNAIFTNPAALTKSPYKWELSLLDLNIGFNENILTSIDPVTKIAGGDYSSLSSVVGKNINVAPINDFTYLTLGWNDFRISTGVAVNTNLNLKFHDDLFNPAGLAEAQVLATATGILNMGYTFMSNLHVGTSFKYIGSAMVNIGVNTVNYATVGESIQNAVNNMTYTPAFDLGVIYDLEDLTNYFSIGVLDSIINYSKPSIGLSILNMGSGSSSSLDGIVPMTVNMGLSLHPMGWKWMTLNMDYVDMFDGYTINSSRGVAAKLRGGFEMAYNTWWFRTALRAGMMNGTYTAGLNLYLVGLDLGLTTYAEELGGYVGQQLDRRYLVNLGIKF